MARLRQGKARQVRQTRTRQGKGREGKGRDGKGRQGKAGVRHAQENYRGPLSVTPRIWQGRYAQKNYRGPLSRKLSVDAVSGTTFVKRC